MPRRVAAAVVCGLLLLLGMPASAGAGEGGGVIALGGAADLGSSRSVDVAGRIVGLVPTPSGKGYWQVASDGGIFSFGDARFLGSTGGMRLNRPIVGMASSPSGQGYWLVASDGGIFSFGDAVFHGSAGDRGLPEQVVGIARSTDGDGYWLATLDGRVLPFGDAVDGGSVAGSCMDQPVVGIAARAIGGYWLATSTFLPAVPPPAADPIDIVAAESANITTLLRVRQGCEPTPSPTAGRLSSPLPGARVTSGFGSRIHPVYRKPQMHTGIDLAGGSAILAPADGVVVQVLLREGFGLTTVIDHGDGLGTVYGHQAAVSVRPGDRVVRGQRIGTVGRSGYATGLHLHFEVRVHGEPTEPRQWL